MNTFLTWLGNNWFKLVMTVLAGIAACFVCWGATKYVKSLAPCTPVPDATSAVDPAAAGVPTPATPGTATTTGSSGGDMVVTEDDQRGFGIDQRRAGLDQGYNLRGLKRMNRAQLNALGDAAWEEYCKANSLPTPRPAKSATKSAPKPPAAKPAPGGRSA